MIREGFHIHQFLDTLSIYLSKHDHMQATKRTKTVLTTLFRYPATQLIVVDYFLSDNNPKYRANIPSQHFLKLILYSIRECR